MGYRGGIGCEGTTVSPTQPNLLDVSATNTPGVYAIPFNPSSPRSIAIAVVPAAYCARVGRSERADGHFHFTGRKRLQRRQRPRRFIKGGDGLYYMVGNDNSGNLSKGQMSSAACWHVHSRMPPAPDLLYPGLVPARSAERRDDRHVFIIAGDKPGKDLNYRGLTIASTTLLSMSPKAAAATAYQHRFLSGWALWHAPTGNRRQPGNLDANHLSPRFATLLPSTGTNFLSGMFFALTPPIYVCDEGDGTFVTPATAGAKQLLTLNRWPPQAQQKWRLISGTWVMQYVLGMD